MADKKMQYSIELDPKKVRGANISRYSDGYSYASMSFKMADGEYMNVSYEWQGNSIPEFAMNVMDIMKGIGEKASISLSDESADYLERTGNMLLDRAAKMKKEMKKDNKDGKDPDMLDEEDDNMNKKDGKCKTKKK